jgi:hypothetical protein
MLVHFNNELYLGCEVVYDVHKQHKIYVFLSQPFTPEMLQEYFEGFEYSDHFGKIYYKYHNCFYCKEYTIGFKKCFDLKIDTYDKVGKDYLSLNYFIFLCLNRNINLTWKGEK